MKRHTSYSEDQDFIKSIISSSLLEDSISFITSQFEVDELYETETLEQWAIYNGFVKESDMDGRIDALEDEIEDLKSRLNDSNHE